MSRKYRTEESPTPCRKCRNCWNWDNEVVCIARKGKSYRDFDIDIETSFKDYSKRKCKDFKRKDASN